MNEALEQLLIQAVAFGAALLAMHLVLATGFAFGERWRRRLQRTVRREGGDPGAIALRPGAVAQDERKSA